MRKLWWVVLFGVVAKDPSFKDLTVCSLATCVVWVDWLCILTTACTKCLQAKLGHTGRHGEDKKNVWNRSVHHCFHRVFVVSKVPPTNEQRECTFNWIIRDHYLNLDMVQYMTLTYFKFEFASWWLTSWKHLCSLYFEFMFISQQFFTNQNASIASHHENSTRLPPKTPITIRKLPFFVALF